MSKDDWLKMWAASKVIELELDTFDIKGSGPLVENKRKISVRYMTREIKEIKRLIQKELGRME